MAEVAALAETQEFPSSAGTGVSLHAFWIGSVFRADRQLHVSARRTRGDRGRRYVNDAGYAWSTCVGRLCRCRGFVQGWLKVISRGDGGTST